MRVRRSALASIATAATAVLLLAGCGGSPGGSGGKTLEAAWVDEGRAVAVLIEDSEGCGPIVSSVQAKRQTVTITLDEPAEQKHGCILDIIEPARVAMLPKGVDPKRDVTLVVQHGANTWHAKLRGNPSLAGTPGDDSLRTPTAGWVSDDKLVLLTWGSSSCHPVVTSTELTDDGAIVHFADSPSACTTDLVPRTAVIEFDGFEGTDAEAFELSLRGGRADGRAIVRQG